MRCVKVAAFAAFGLLSVLQPSEAHAQGFFSKLFGGSAPPVAQPMVTPYRVQPRPSPRERDRSDQNQSSANFSGKYRTLCVRMCDGYYWPISYATTRSGFYRDANICRSNCGGDARLYFHASSDSDTTEMVDISGRPYALTPNAYTYRRKVVEGCACKPQPWAQSEQDRHRMYALYEADKARGRDAIASNERAPRQVLQGPSDPAVGRALAVIAEPAVPVASVTPADGAPTEAPAGPPASSAAVGPTVERATPAAPQGPQIGKRQVRNQPGGGNPTVDGNRRAIARQGQPKPTQASAKLPGSNGGPFGLGAGGGGKRWPGE